MVEDRPRPRRGGDSIIPAADETEILRRVAHGVAHGMNNVLATVMGLASVLETELERGSQPADDVRAILEASRLGLNLTRSLLNLAQGGTPRLAPVSMNELVESVASFLRPSLREAIQIETRLASDLALVAGDAAQLKHAVMSLALNASEAIVASGTLTFTTSHVVLQADQLRGERCRPGNYVRLQVGDTGSGMDGAALERAFDPFFSTKSTQSSAGLGLPLVYGTVRAHGGRVVLYSKQGLGTTVTVDLPVIDPRFLSSQPPGSEEVRQRNETVLAVDDDALVLRSSRRLLEKLGYDVISASSGEEAIEIYAQEADRISFVLLDLVMPDMDGSTVLRRLLRTDPKARVVICTGYGAEDSTQDLLAAGAVAFIDKPYTLGQLRKVLEPLG